MRSLNLICYSFITSGSSFFISSARAALKLMPPISSHWPTTSEADVGGMAVEAECSHQYPITCCCCVTDGSRGAVWQNGVWHKSVDEAKVWNWSPPQRRNGTHWHSLTRAECLWRPTSGCEHSEVMGGVFQQWWQRQWGTSTGAIFTSTACRLRIIEALKLEKTAEII